MTMRPRSPRPSLATLAFALLFLAQALALALAGTAHAHGDTLKVVITGQRDARVTADVTWENDGDPVEEAVAATVNAVSADGTRTAGPWRLVRDLAGGAAAWTTAETLPPGSWTVTVDAGFPSLGHAEREIAVPVVDPAPTAAPSGPVTAAPPAPAAPVPARPASTGRDAGTGTGSAAGPGTDGAAWWTTAGVAGIALAGAAAGVLLRRRRLRHR
ncbi:hypothetical protein ACGFXC_07160 [Streptomyces sp. NPDC048507]|uniref:hypothetical protein n=1 Tax=Streptomyces sp. NPDC048507 TaxID=3365560 RepID=UPI00371A78D6